MNGADEMVLYPRSDLRLNKLAVPMPPARATTEPRTGDDGEDDTTLHHDGTACTIELRVLAGPAAVKGELSRFQHPGDRPYLQVTDDEWATERRLRLRPESGDGSVGVDLPPTMRDIQAQWRVPDGVWEAVDQDTMVISADSGSTTGLAVPVVIPATFAAGSSAGARIFTNAGSVPLHWTARMYGPCTGPKLTLEISGQPPRSLVFKPSMVLGAGVYLDVDSRARTVWLLGDTSNSRLFEVDYTATTWWQLPRGVSQVRYHPASGIGAGSACELYTRTQWLP